MENGWFKRDFIQNDVIFNDGFKLRILMVVNILSLLINCKN